MKSIMLTVVLLTFATAVTASETEKVTLRVGGVECRSCVKNLRTALLKTPGVKDCTLKATGNVVKNFFGLEQPEWHAVIEYENGAVTPEQLVKVVASASNDQFTYHASVVKAGP